MVGSKKLFYIRINIKIKKLYSNISISEDVASRFSYSTFIETVKLLWVNFITTRIKHHDIIRKIIMETKTEAHS